jgi:hypothetical protein
MVSGRKSIKSVFNLSDKKALKLPAKNKKRPVFENRAFLIIING